MIKKFSELKVGDKFTHEGISYEKIVEERISCCRANNAKQIDQPTTKIQVLPITEVEVTTE